MENPEKEIRGVITNLTQGSSQVQSNTIDVYFTPNAIFVHPFCRTWNMGSSRWYVKKIYQWYKIMSPRIDLDIKSVAYDRDTLKLYATISQVFSIWVIPFHSSPVTLTTVLDLVPHTKTTSRGMDGQDAPKTLYYIAKQEDFYQTSEFVKFLTPSAALPVYIWQSFATLFCVMGVFLLSMPMTLLRLCFLMMFKPSTLFTFCDNTPNQAELENKVDS